MTTVEPGRVYLATVRGVPDTLCIVRRYDRLAHDLIGDMGATYLADATDFVGPLVVLNIDNETASELRGCSDTLHEHGYSNSGDFLSDLADEIAKQTKPPRIAEPGLWGVVSTGLGDSLLHHMHRMDGGWVDQDGCLRDWPDLLDPVLVRDGVASARVKS